MDNDNRRTLQEILEESIISGSVRILDDSPPVNVLVTNDIHTNSEEDKKKVEMDFEQWKKETADDRKEEQPVRPLTGNEKQEIKRRWLVAGMFFKTMNDNFSMRYRYLCQDVISKLKSKIEIIDSDKKIDIREKRRLRENIDSSLRLYNDLINQWKMIEYITQKDIYNAMEEFRLNWRERSISKVVREVVLEDINIEEHHMGDFVLCFSPHNCIMYVIALQPNYYRCREDSYVHPHVSGRIICFGDASIEYELAVKLMDISTMFDIAERVIHSYNRGGAYAPLEDWEQEVEPCYICGYGLNEDNSHYCEYCERTVCEGCIVYDEDSEQVFCSECATYCRICDRVTLYENVYTCVECDKIVCVNCIHECPECGDVLCKECGKECDECGDVVCLPHYTRCTECKGAFCENCIVIDEENGYKYCKECHDSIVDEREEIKEQEEQERETEEVNNVKDTETA